MRRELKGDVAVPKVLLAALLNTGDWTMENEVARKALRRVANIRFEDAPAYDDLSSFADNIVVSSLGDKQRNS